MLVLSRKTNETIVINTAHGPITVQVNRVNGERVSIGIIAPAEVAIRRGELERKGVA